MPIPKRRRRFIWWLLLCVVAFSLGHLLYRGIFRWAETPVFVQPVLQKSEVRLIFDALHMAMPDSLTRAEFGANVDVPIISMAVRFDVGSAELSQIFGAGWKLEIQHLGPSDGRLSELDFRHGAAGSTWGNWWDVMPSHDGDQFWERPASEEKSFWLAVVRNRQSGGSVYIVTNGFNLNELPASLWDKIQSHGILVGLVPGQGSWYGAAWVGSGISPGP
jgi:hypothetical protein